MSNNSVLFDTPGPKAAARHRIYTVLAVVVLLGLLAVAVMRLADNNQFEGRKWEPFVSPVYIERFLVDGVLETLKMAVAAIILAVIFGALFGIGKLSEHRPLRWFSWLVVEFWRAVPVLLAMVLVFYVWGIDRGDTGAFWSVVVALMLYNGAVLAEVFRAGINAVPKGQVEAAYALGMRKTAVMMQIQLPQAVKIMLPALISQMVVALKDTSLGYAVAAPGLTNVAKLTYNSPSNGQNIIPTVLVTAGLYIVMNLILTWIATWVQKKFVGEKRIDVAAAAAGQD
ncbi:amino acid ABC transporter permease [Nocardioides sambongensis]|uniref:amino acid ABC transporter permease n=1 Tax=Nocardioides sambongensis TaxID=2589074 RepID=UPI001128A6AB|nr:amino acid ABC transporter permease [Nocardioides sambongensis]